MPSVAARRNATEGGVLIQFCKKMAKAAKKKGFNKILLTLTLTKVL
jgi:hypothetical protein